MMNIFYLDHDPVVAAKMHCDVHSYKMISESVLMLCNAHRYLDGDSYADEVGMFPMGYENHPCSKWVRQSAANYNWLLVMVTELAKEYYKRYGSRKKEPVQHSHAALIPALNKLPDNVKLKAFTQPHLGMPDEYKCDDPVQSYRNYYLGEKLGHIQNGTYKYTEAPSWACA
jgi:hypothetical protein